MTHTNDRNLLLGILALQNDLVTRDHLIEAMNAWAVAKDRPLGQILVEQGALDREHRKLLEQLLDVHVQRHGSVQESLAGCELTSSVRFALECVPDAAVQTSIRSLRQRCEPAGVVDATRTFTGPTPIGAPLSEIRYRILRPHAKGGLGEVFVAEDLELHREVALKEIQRQHADQDTSRGRFVLEAEITGGLEHPGIVPVYGLGSYADGRPFYAMRFIKGDNLKYAIARFHQSATRFNGLEFRQLLGRFIDVCNAVAYAHSRGVLHRDLKPGNIMLGKFGETLVVDWGLAKVVGRADSSGEELTLAPISGSGVAETIQGMAMGTPAYMSPEQAMGKVAELGPATDVYSLGATLYALLINRPPILDEDLATALQKVQSGDIPRPRSLNAAIPKPLEAVCLKAMAMHPDQRHASAVALGEDIEHWLADEPVTAYHENVWQRVGRWSRRNREWTRAGAALMAMVIVFTVAILLVNRARQAAINLANKNDTIARQEQLAKREAITRLREARQTVDTWLTEMSGTLQYYPLMREVRTRLLQQAVEQYQQVATQLGDDPELKLERARANLSLSDVQRQLVDMEGAQRACGAALTLLNDMLRAPAPAPEVVEEWANGQRRLGLIHADMGDEIASDAAYRAAMERLGQVPDDAQQRTTYTETLASVLTNWSELAMAHGHSADATTRLDQARQLFEGLVQRAPKEPRHKLSLATILTILARLEMSAGRYREAQGNWATALAVLDDVVHQFPDQPKFRETRASTRLEAASLLRLQGKYEEELTVYEVILADFSALQKALPDVPSYRESIALTHTDLAQALRELGRNPEALASLELAGPVLDQLTIEYPTEPRYYEAHATCRDILAQTLLDLNKPADAKARAESAVESYQRLASLYADVPEYRERLAVCQSHLGQALHRLQDPAARSAFEDAIRLLDVLGEENREHPTYRSVKAQVLQHLGLWHLDNGDRLRAETSYRDSITLWKSLAQQESPEHLYWLCRGLLLCPVEGCRDVPTAMQVAQRLEQLAPDNAGYLAIQGIAHYRMAQWDPAMEFLQRATKLRTADNPEDWFFISMTQTQLEQHEDARVSFERASRAMEQCTPGSKDLIRERDEAEQLRRDRVVAPVDPVLPAGQKS